MTYSIAVQPPKKLTPKYGLEHTHCCAHPCVCRRPGQPECVACRVAQVPSFAHVVRNYRYGPERAVTTETPHGDRRS